MESSDSMRAHWLVLVLALAAPLVLGVAGRLLEPDARGWGTHEQLGFRPCYPMAHWNVPCPGCGVTTSVALLARGELVLALRTQPLGPALAVAALAGASWALAGHARGHDLARRAARLPWRLLASSAGLFLLAAWLYKLLAVRGAG